MSISSIQPLFTKMIFFASSVECTNTSLMDTDGASTAELIVTAILSIKSFGAEHVVYPDHTKADTHYQLILGWLYLAH